MVKVSVAMTTFNDENTIISCAGSISESELSAG